MKKITSFINLDNISIKYKFFIPLLMIVFLANALQLGLSLVTLRDNLSSQLLHKGLFLANTLSFAVSEPLSLGVIQSIQQQITSTRVIEKEIVYIKVMNLNGEVRAASGIIIDESEIPKEELSLLNSISTINYTLDDHKRLFTVKIPVYISGGNEDIKIGFLEFALTTKYMETTKALLTSLTISIFLVLVLLSIFLANNLTNKTILLPIKNMEATVKLVSLGILDRLIKVTSNDEIGYFANSFNNMISALREEKKKTHEYLVELSLHKEHLEELVSDRTNQLEAKNKQIMDEIHYAATIQSAILPKREVFSNFFKDHFAIWSPREIVGGDFFWIYDPTKQTIMNQSNGLIKQRRDPFFVAVADCTGHGVPGAFMTIMTNAILNQVISDARFNDPGLILQELNRLIKVTLGQNEIQGGTDDGLDIGLCYINPQANTLTFAGAKLSLYYCFDTKVFEVKGDKQSIGYHRSDANYVYKNNTVKLTPNMSFYMTSDGYIEQFGGEKKIPFGKNRLKNIIERNYSKPFVEQKVIIEKELMNYRIDEAQVDDISMLGFSVG